MRTLQDVGVPSRVALSVKRMLARNEYEGLET
jgi:hypothetical protein